MLEITRDGARRLKSAVALLIELFATAFLTALVLFLTPRAVTVPLIVAVVITSYIVVAMGRPLDRVARRLLPRRRFASHVVLALQRTLVVVPFQFFVQPLPPSWRSAGLLVLAFAGVALAIATVSFLLPRGASLEALLLPSGPVVTHTTTRGPRDGSSGEIER